MRTYTTVFRKHIGRFAGTLLPFIGEGTFPSGQSKGSQDDCSMNSSVQLRGVALKRWTQAPRNLTERLYALHDGCRVLEARKRSYQWTPSKVQTTLRNWRTASKVNDVDEYNTGQSGSDNDGDGSASGSLGVCLNIDWAWCWIMEDQQVSTQAKRSLHFGFVCLFVITQMLQLLTTYVCLYELNMLLRYVKYCLFLNACQKHFSEAHRTFYSAQSNP